MEDWDVDKLLASYRHSIEEVLYVVYKGHRYKWTLLFMVFISRYIDKCHYRIWFRWDNLFNYYINIWSY